MCNCNYVFWITGKLNAMVVLIRFFCLLYCSRTMYKNCYVKAFMGLPNTCRHSKLLTALHIRSVHIILTDTLCSLFNRILCLPSCSVATPVLMYTVQCFLRNGCVYSGTLIDRILKLHISPLRALCGPPRELAAADGTVDSITTVLNMNLCKKLLRTTVVVFIMSFLIVYA